MGHRPIDDRHRTLARTMRRRMGEGEGRLWARLRLGQLDGLRFRRQAPIGTYIVDFLCLDRRLVVEVDGGQHSADSHARADQVRTAWLAQEGFRVVRFWTSEVKENVDGVCAAIVEAAAAPIRAHHTAADDFRRTWAMRSGQLEAWRQGAVRSPPLRGRPQSLGRRP